MIIDRCILLLLLGLVGGCLAQSSNDVRRENDAILAVKDDVTVPSMQSHVSFIVRLLSCYYENMEIQPLENNEAIEIYNKFWRDAVDSSHDNGIAIIQSSMAGMFKLVPTAKCDKKALAADYAYAFVHFWPEACGQTYMYDMAFIFGDSRAGVLDRLWQELELDLSCLRPTTMI